MRIFKACQFMLAVSACLGMLIVTVDGQSSRSVTSGMVDDWMNELSNWGRWGEDDELGTLNLISLEKRRSALALASAGVSVSLSHNYLTERAVDATSPIGREMLGPDRPGPFRSDRYTFAYHGYAHSHMDSLCHMMHGGQMYNGFVRDDEVTAEGCAKLAIINFKYICFTFRVILNIYPFVFDLI